MIRVVLQIDEVAGKDGMRITVEENDATTAYEREKGFVYCRRMSAALKALAALEMGGRK